MEEVDKGCSEFCITVGTVTRTVGILIHSWLKALAVNLSQPSSWLGLHAGIFGSYNRRWLEADLVFCAKPSSSSSWVWVGDVSFSTGSSGSPGQRAVKWLCMAASSRKHLCPPICISVTYFLTLVLSLELHGIYSKLVIRGQQQPVSYIVIWRMRINTVVWICTHCLWHKIAVK